MKHLLILFTLLVSQTFAADAPQTYTGDITGVVCAACKEHVTAALVAKLPGVQKVEIQRGEKLGVNTITITATNAAVTKETAMTALGDLAQSYQIVSLAKK